MAFENPSGAADAQWLTSGLPSMLLTGLGQTPSLDVVESQRVDEVLKDLGLNAASMDKSRVLEVGRRVARARSLSARCQDWRRPAHRRAGQDVASGRLLGAHSVHGTDVFPLADNLTSRNQTEPECDRSTGGKRDCQITSSYPEAFRAYTEGLEASNDQRDLDAVKRLRRAMDMNPSFASAYSTWQKLKCAWVTPRLLKSTRGR